MTERKFLYSQVILTKESRELVRHYARGVKPLLTKNHCHHMTIQFGEVDGRTPEQTVRHLGERVQLRIIGHVENENIQAFHVVLFGILGERAGAPVRYNLTPSRLGPWGERSLGTVNKYPHVTISTSESGKPYESNKAFDDSAVRPNETDSTYTKVDGPVITGTVTLVDPKGYVFDGLDEYESKQALEVFG